MTAAEATSTNDEARIRLLPSDLIDKIAAGEVIERPSSAVKELLENAIDAGARAIRVTLAEGGLKRLCVEDDGRGMSPTDARNCLLRHATSKLAHADDLFAIRTLGFRGEALSSIAGISKLTLTTRRAQDAAATRIVCVGGEIESVALVGSPVGTCIDVENLFFNTPARRKFMRSPATEQAHVVEAALRVVLGAGDCGIVVTSGERRLLDIPEEAADQARITAALGAKIREVFSFGTSADGVRVNGYITAPEHDRADSKGMWFFVNGRFVRDRMIQRAVLDGYRSMVDRGRYPVCVVHIELDASAVDVNVHPQKTEVRFSDTQAIFRTVSSAVTQVLSTTPWALQQQGARKATQTYFERIQHAPLEVREQRVVYSPAPRSASAQRQETSVDTARLTSTPLLFPEPERAATVFDSRATKLDALYSSLRVLGRGLGVFVLCESHHDGGEIVVIDEEAAYQRVVYEQLRAQAAGDGVLTEQLMFPETLETYGAAHALLEDRWHTLSAYGFEVEPVGPGRFAVRAIPAGLNADNAAALVADLMEEITACAGRAEDDTLMRVLSRCARHAVVRSGDGTEVRALLTQLDAVDWSVSPPHCRPVSHRISRKELGKIFQR